MLVRRTCSFLARHACWQSASFRFSSSALGLRTAHSIALQCRSHPAKPSSLSQQSSPQNGGRSMSSGKLWQLWCPKTVCVDANPITALLTVHVHMAINPSHTARAHTSLIQARQFVGKYSSHCCGTRSARARQPIAGAGSSASEFATSALVGTAGVPATGASTAIADLFLPIPRILIWTYPYRAQNTGTVIMLKKTDGENTFPSSSPGR